MRPTGDARGTAIEVGAAFLKLGLSSFGGPIAHLGYFRTEFVERRRWLDERHFAQLLALCQFLPGPASSQMGFALGLLRAGWAGAIAAFVAFTLPSALLLFAFASLHAYFAGPWGQAVIHGLKLVAVAVVAQAVVAMARTLAPDGPRRLLAIAAAAVLLLAANAWMPLVLLAGAAALGPWLCRHVEATEVESFALHYGRRTGAWLLAAFAVLLVMALAVAPTLSPLGQVGAAFYRAGALVFGGGHVVLPMLEQAVVAPGWVDRDSFLAGYGAAQAVPGPMFSLAAFLGERLGEGHGGPSGAVIALLAIFLPGLLLVAGALPFSRALARRRGAVRSVAAMNAVVVGILAAALIDPVIVAGVQGISDALVALAAFALLVFARWSALAAVAFCVAAALAVAAIAA